MELLKNYSLAVYDYQDKKLCDLANENIFIKGEAYNINLHLEINGYKELNFDLPAKIEDNNGNIIDNFRLDFIKNEYKVKVKIDNEIHDFIIKKVERQRDSNGAIFYSVKCVCAAFDKLSRSGLDLYFEDEVGNAQTLLSKVLEGSDWSVGVVDTFIQDDSHEKYRTLSGEKTNRYSLIQEICNLFECYPVFHTDTKKVDLRSEIGVNRGVQFRYSKNLKEIIQNIESDEIITKLWVEGGEHPDQGLTLISLYNPTGENYILNFQYYIDLGLLTSSQITAIGQFQSNIMTINNTINSLLNEISTLSTQKLLKESEKEGKEIEKTTKQQTIEELNAKIAIEKANTIKQQLISQRDTLLSQVNTLTSEINSLANEISNLESQISSKESELNIQLNNKKIAIQNLELTVGDFIREGIYQNTNYIDAEALYKDALSVSAKLAYPRVSYEVNVLDLSRLTGYEIEKFGLGDTVYIIDETLSINTNGRITQIDYVLDSPKNTRITISNFDTKFEDLFKKIITATNIINSRKEMYDRVRGINPDGTLNYDLLQKTLDNNSFQLQFGVNNNIIANRHGITIIDHNNPLRMIQLNSGGIFVTSDGGITWRHVISADGISALNITTGVIDTKVIQIWNSEQPRFYWDADGLIALDATDPNKWIKFNQNGIFYTKDGGQTYLNAITFDGVILEDLSVTNAKIANAAIDSAKIANAAIGTAHIQDLAVTNAKIANAAIDSAKIANAAITEAKIADAAITNAKIANGAIDSAKIRDAAITNAKIANLAVDSAKIQDAAITTAKIQDAAINTAKIQDAAINTAKIQDGAITNAKIANAAIDGAKIAQASIDTAHIKTGAITTALITQGAIGTAQIADGSITDAKVVSLNANKINAGTINTGQVTIQGANGKLKISNNRLQVFDNQPMPVERVSIGDVNNDGTVYGIRVRGADGQTVLYDHNGVYTEGITDGAITNPKIADDAVDSRVIAANSVLAEHIVAGTITGDKIAARTITANNIATNTITAASGVIADAAITTAKIADGAITTAKIAHAAVDTAKIADASITDAKIVDLRADKITSGTINSAIVRVGDFEQIELNGYSNAILVKDAILPKVEIGRYNYDTDVQLATFTRGSIAYKPDGTQIRDDQPRYVVGQVGKMIMGEEGTTNAFNNPSFEGGTTGWDTGGFGDNTLLTSVTDDVYSGNKAVKVERISGGQPGTGATISQTIGTRIVLNRNEQVTVSFWVKGKGATIGKTVRAHIYATNGTNTISTGTFYTLTSEWQRITHTLTWPYATATTNIYGYCRAENINIGDYFYVDAAQIEKKPYVTSFIDGTRAAETLYIPADRLNEQEGSIRFRYTPPVASNIEQFILVSPLFGISTNVAAGQVKLYYGWNASTQVVLTASQVLSTSSEYQFAVTWKQGNFVKLYINGSLKASYTW